MAEPKEIISAQLAHVASKAQPQISHSVASRHDYDPLFQQKPYDVKTASDVNKNNDDETGSSTTSDLAQIRALLLASPAARNASKLHNGQQSGSNNLSQRTRALTANLVTQGVESLVSQSPGKSPVIGINSAPGDVTEREP